MKITAIKHKLGAMYIRESTESQDKGYSPAKQENDIREYAKKHNIEIVSEYKDLISGTNALKRADFQQMMSDAEKKKFDVILVFHSSRFARNVGEARKYKSHLREKLGIDVISVSQNFGDWNEPSAFINEGINELFDAHYSKQLSFWMRNAFAEKRKQGFSLGQPPLGYYKKKLGYDKERERTLYAKDWSVDEKGSNIVKDLFKSYASGKYSMGDLAKYLNDKGYKTKHKNAFTHSSIKDILRNKAYLGYVTSPRRGYDEPMGRHTPIITQDLYDKVQEVLGERRRTFGRPVAKNRFYLLQGLVYCYHCINHLKGRENQKNNWFVPKMYCHTQNDRKGNELHYYTCKFKRENKTCNQPDVHCSIIDEQVIDYMQSFKAPEDVIKLTLKKISETFDGYQNNSNEMTAVKQLQAKKNKINFKYDNTDELTNEEYLKQIREIDEGLKKYNNLGIIHNDIKSKKSIALKLSECFLRDFKSLWQRNIGDVERRDWIKMAIRRIWVKNDIVVAIEPHEEFKPMFSTLKVLGQSPLATPKE